MTDLVVISNPQTSGAAGNTCARNTRAPKFFRAAWSVVGFIFRLPAHALLLLIRLYQRFLSPALPVFFGSTCGCRFAPTCSHYAAEAIRVHGALIGVILATIRLLKCTPLHPGGIDVVPPRRTGPRCQRVNA
jgi:uncharacterized protein